MKKAIVILYVLLGVQTLGVGLGFLFSYAVMNQAFYDAGKAIGENLIVICDQRYIRK